MFKILLSLFFLLNFLNYANANISTSAQKNLIDSNIIYDGISCSELTGLLGGKTSANFLWLGNKKEEENAYVVINSKNNNVYKIFYVCEKNRYNFDETDLIDDLLSDFDFIKTFDDSFDLFTHIFSITSQNSTQYIMSRLQSAKYYNIDKQSLREARVNSKKIKEPKKITTKQETKITKKKDPVKKETVKKDPEVSKDTVAPKLKINDKFVVNNANYQITGEVSDKGSGKIYIKVKDGNTENFIDVIDGKFVIERFSPVDEELEIVAIDQWNNESKKLVKVIVKSKKNTVRIVEKLDPSKIRSKDSPNKVAIIIGIQDYVNSPKASYANLDAEYFNEYVKRGFGVRDENIKLLIDNKATRSNYEETLLLWLPNKIKKNVTELIIFYSGHGLGTPDGKELYLLAHDSKTEEVLLPSTALLRSKLIKEISNLNPKSVTLFFDTCYSGTSRENESLLVAAKPIRILADDDTEIPDNITIFTSSLMNQISSGFKEAKNGLFSYYLMKGLEGKADQNNDKKITNGEIYSYMDENVSKIAAELGRQQNPSLNGDPDQVLMRY